MKHGLNKEILNDLQDIDEDQEIDLSDIEDIEALFIEEKSIEPPETLFHGIMDKLELVYEDEALEKSSRRKINILENIKYLLLAVRLQVSLLDVRFWLASIVIFIFGLLNIKTNENFNVILLGPIVSAFSIYYLYRGKYYNVFEMESACKYSMYEISLARTIIIIFYNILFVTSMAFINYFVWNSNIWLYLIISWLSPLLFSYYLTLYFFYKKGLIQSIMVNIFSWSIYTILFCKFNNSLWIGVNLILIFLSMIMLFVLFKNMKKNYA